MGSNKTRVMTKAVTLLVSYKNYVAYLSNDYRPANAVYSVVVLYNVRLSVVVESSV